MSSSSIRMRDPYGQTPGNVFTDFDWIHQHQQELLDKYGECSIIVYQKQVIGVGNTYAEALRAAERDLLPGLGEVTPVHQELRQRHPFLRVLPKQP